MERIRWGVIGAAGIAHKWMKGARQLADTHVVAVASRTKSSAEALAEAFGIPCVEDSVEALLARDDVDAVYVATPHTSHCALSFAAMEHGKAVLCEKIMAMNADEARRMFACSQSMGRFLMEAMWTRCFPGLAEARALLESGAIGTLRSIRASFAFNASVDGEHRLLNPAYGGGALLDVGVYCLHLCDVLLHQKPTEVHSFARLSESGAIDVQDSIIARYPGDMLAELTCAVKCDMGAGAKLYGSEGSISFPVFCAPTELILRRNGKPEERRAFPVPNTDPAFTDDGYQYEIAHVNQCLRDGRIESPEVTAQATLNVLETCDALRQSWGLRYAADRR